MASSELKQRVRDDPTATTEATDAVPSSQKTAKKLSVRAKRGIPSLALAVSLTMALTALNITYFGFPRIHGAQKLLWFLPLWALHATCLISSILMGLSAWLVWAEGGFHRNPQALGLYLVQMGLALAWDPIVFRVGANWVGMAVAVAMVGTMIACYKKFKEVNSTAGDIVKLCFAWAGFVCIVNLKLISM